MKKAILSLSLIPLLVGCAQRTFDNNSSLDQVIKVDMSENDPSLQDDEDGLNWLEEKILEGGSSFLKTGLTSLAVYGLKTACSEMGIDVRDTTTKKLDLIIEKLDAIKNQISEGFNALTNKVQQVQDENYMNNILDRLNEIRTPILAQMSILEDLAIKEQSGYDQEKLIKERDTFINNFSSKLNFYGLSNRVVASAERLAREFYHPNNVKTSQTLMDLYNNTLGANDVWDYQSIEPRTNFIKECAFLLNSLALLAKIECSYEISKYAEGDSNIIGIKTEFETMCNVVNTVNGMFQNELIKLKEIKDRHDDYLKPTMSHYKRSFDSNGYVHITTDYTISAYLATVNLDTVSYSNIVDDYYDNATSHCYKVFNSDNNFLTTLYNDYETYIKSFKVSEDYNLKYYLKDIGFRIPGNDKNIFDEAIGIYKDIPDAKRVGRGIFRGVDYYAYYRYYSWKGNLESRDYCRVGQTFWNNYDDVTNYDDNINKYFVTFMNANNEELLGDVRWSILHRDGSSSSDLLSHLYRGSKSNDTYTPSYKLKL